MNATAAELIERVLPPRSGLRQWVLTFPFSWRRRLARDAGLLDRLTRIVVETVFNPEEFRVRRRARRQGQNVQNLSSAIEAEQVTKHLVDRVAPVLDALKRGGIRGLALKDQLGKVRLKFDVVLSEHKGATAADAVEKLNDILQSSGERELIALWRARFNVGDIVIRHGNPLARFVDSLAKLL
jgi:hypothetical protein